MNTVFSSAMTPDDIFGVSIFAFFLLAVLTFMYISYRFMKETGGRAKKGERVMMYGSVVGVILVLVYAVFALIFKIII